MLPHPIKRINVLIADNQPMFRQGLANYLKELKNFGNVTQNVGEVKITELTILRGCLREIVCICRCNN